MLYLIVSDWHGIDPEKVRECVGTNYDAFISLGDHDLASTLRGCMEWEREFQSQGKMTISLPGNHEHAILHKMDIFSSHFIEFASGDDDFKRWAVDTYYLHQKLVDDPEVMEVYGKGNIEERTIGQLASEALGKL